MSAQEVGVPAPLFNPLPKLAGAAGAKGLTKAHTDLPRPSALTIPRKARAALKLIRIDTPLMWRLAAHGAVLVLTVGVFVTARHPIPLTAEASAGQTDSLSIAGLVARDAREVLPNQVLGTEDSAAAPAPAASGDSDATGFVSTGLLAEADPSLLPWDEPQVYVVQEGDTITAIAAAHGLEPETLLYANPDLRENPHFLTVGQTVTILPVNGVLHVVEEGDTIESVAAKYKAEAAAITAYSPNGLKTGDALVPGAEVVVPGGEMDIEIPSYYQFVQGQSGSSAAWSSNGGQGPVVGSGTFYKATYGRISTWFSRWHRAVDIANKTGTPIYAIDGGSVEVAGWYGWAGNAVIINHGTGFESLYAHMSSIAVSAGQTVQKGQIIGGIGCTYGKGGRCTGPHLHLEMYYQGVNVNPCNYGVCP
jgi:murein DD-endopeptidase MepM/ murein hydrolase activator NlpD